MKGNSYSASVSSGECMSFLILGNCVLLFSAQSYGLGSPALLLMVYTKSKQNTVFPP